MNQLRRVIVDYKKLTPEVLKLLVELYPDGYDEEDIISFKSVNGELIEAVEVTTVDTVYLVKISAKLEDTMANFDVVEYEEYKPDETEDVDEIPLESREEE